MMHRKTIVRIVSLATLWSGTLSLLPPPTLAQGADPLVMVVNRANPLSTMTRADAKRLVLGQMNTWADGKKVTVVLRPQGSADRNLLLQSLCGMNEAEYTRFEMQVMFTGRVAAKLQEEASPAAIKAFIKSNPGAVGFLRETDVDKELKGVLTL